MLSKCRGHQRALPSRLLLGVTGFFRCLESSCSICTTTCRHDWPDVVSGKCFRQSACPCPGLVSSQRPAKWHRLISSKIESSGQKDWICSDLHCFLSMRWTSNRLTTDLIHLIPSTFSRNSKDQKNSQKSKGQNESKKTKYLLLYSHCMETFRFKSASSKRWSRFHVRSLRSSCPKRFTMETSKKNENVMYIIYLGNPFCELLPKFHFDNFQFCRNRVFMGCAYL